MQENDAPNSQSSLLDVLEIRDSVLAALQYRKTRDQWRDWIETRPLWMGQVLRGEVPFSRERYLSQVAADLCDPSILTYEDPADFLRLKGYFQNHDLLDNIERHERQHWQSAVDNSVPAVVGVFFISEPEGLGIQPFAMISDIPDDMSDERFLEVFRLMVAAVDDPSDLDSYANGERDDIDAIMKRY